MRPVMRHILVLLLVAAQLALGPSAGGVVCLGSPVEDTQIVESCCSHDSAHAGWPVPVPDEHDQDCPCIDVATPDARAEQVRGDELFHGAAVLFLAPVAFEPRWSLVNAACPAPFRPPGPAPGLSTTRLLL